MKKCNLKVFITPIIKIFWNPKWSLKTKGYLMILASALCFSSYGVWARLIGHQFGVFYQGWVRSAIILAALLPITIIKKHFEPIKKPYRIWFTVTMILTVCSQVPFYFAFNHLSIGTAILIFYGFLLITSYLIGWIFLSEKITLIKIVSFFLSCLGILLTFGLSMEVFSISAMLIAAFSGFTAGGEIATSKKSTERYSSLLITTYSWGLILITHLPLSIMMGEKQIVPEFNLEWFAMFGYAASGFFGFWLVIEGFKYVDASTGALIGLLEIIFSIIWGILIFNDSLTISIIVGGIVIIIAAVLPDVYSLKQRKAKPAPPPSNLDF